MACSSSEVQRRLAMVEDGHLLDKDMNVAYQISASPASSKVTEVPQTRVRGTGTDPVGVSWPLTGGIPVDTQPEKAFPSLLFPQNRHQQLTWMHTRLEGTSCFSTEDQGEMTMFSRHLHYCLGHFLNAESIYPIATS